MTAQKVARTADAVGEPFTGFPPEGLAFLTELGRQDKAWFDERRGIYQELVVGPAKAFVTAIGDGLAASIAPDIVALPKANGSMAPINNDLRFTPDKPPYKDHLLLRFWEGPDKQTAPTLFVRVGESSLGFATGARFADQMTWRERIDDDRTGAQLADALTALAKGRALDIDGQGYKKVPKPYAEDHPRADLLRHKGGFQARWSEPAPKAMGSAKLVAYCLRRLEACGDVHRWLVTNL
ncbi:MAG: DUF2461 family protein [Actinomycetota bacterium]